MSKKQAVNPAELSIYQLAKNYSKTEPDSLDYISYQLALGSKVTQSIEKKLDKKIQEALVRSHSANEHFIYQTIINQVNDTLHRLADKNSFLLVIPYITNIKDDNWTPPTFKDIEQVLVQEFSQQGLLNDTEFKLCDVFVDGSEVEDFHYSNWYSLHQALYNKEMNLNQPMPFDEEFALIKVNFLLALVNNPESKLLDTIYHSVDAHNPVSIAMENISQTLNTTYPSINWLLMFPNVPLLAVEAGLQSRDSIIIDSLFNNFSNSDLYEFVFFYLQEDQSQAGISIWNKESEALEVLAFVHEKSLNIHITQKMDTYHIPYVKIFNSPINLSKVNMSHMTLNKFLDLSATTTFRGSKT